MFWACYQSSNIFGNGVGSILLNFSTGPPIFIGFGVFILVVAFGFNFIIVPESKDQVVHRTLKQEIIGALSMIVDRRMLYMNA